MKMAAKFFLLPILFLLVSKAEARIEWSEPEVVPEKLVRRNRRVLRFSGVTEPGAQVRIRKNRIKLYLDNGKTRLAKIPQKNKIQFPVVADQDGSFSFDLYLPTIAVEIPIESKQGGAWKTQTLNFRVPDAGVANDFQAIEESFQDQDARMQTLERTDNYYSRKYDQGMVVRDRHGRARFTRTKLRGWGGLGLSYFSNDIGLAPPVGSTSGSTLVIPTWRLGLDWDYSKKVNFKAALRSTSGSTDDIGNVDTQGKDFNWLEVQLSGIYFSDMLSTKSGRLGFDFGFQMQSVPFFRYRPFGGGFANQTAYFDNELYNLHFGLHFEQMNNKVWNYEIYARYLYTFSSGDVFDVDSFPINLEFGGGLTRSLTKTLALGVFGQLHYMSMDTKYSEGSTTLTSDLTLMLFTVDGRLIFSF